MLQKAVISKKNSNFAPQWKDQNRIITAL